MEILVENQHFGFKKSVSSWSGTYDWNFKIWKSRNSVEFHKNQGPKKHDLADEDSENYMHGTISVRVQYLREASV